MKGPEAGTWGKLEAERFQNSLRHSACPGPVLLDCQTPLGWLLLALGPAAPTWGVPVTGNVLSSSGLQQVCAQGLCGLSGLDPEAAGQVRAAGHNQTPEVGTDEGGNSPPPGGLKSRGLAGPLGCVPRLWPHLDL